MSTSAEEGEWEQVAEKERERVKLIEKLFEEPITEAESPAVREAMEKVIDSDKAILARAVDAKNAIHGQAKQLSVEKHAFEEYAKNR